MSKRNQNSVILRFGTKCEAQVGSGDPVDLSSAFEFRTVGNVHGLLRPDRPRDESVSNNDRASSMFIHHLQKRGMFEKNAN